MLIEIPHNHKARVVIIGGGFAGLELAKQLRNNDVQVIILDKNNFHTFQPLLYQVATAALGSDSIAYSLRQIFRNSKNVFFRMGEVSQIITDENLLTIDNDTLHYDYLVIATGAKTNFFGNEGLMVSAMPMKTVAEALDLRSLILQNFEKILMISNERKKQSFMNFVIAGAGPTGVELAGALGELKLNIFPGDYPELDLSKMNIYLVQSGDRVLPSFSPESSAKAKKYLEQLGVTIVLNTKVLDFSGDYVQTSTGQDLIARTLIWTAGVTGNPVRMGFDPLVINKGERYKVNEYNIINGYKNIFAIGDVAASETKKYPGGLPQVAPAAMQQGKHLAGNILRLINNVPLVPFNYKDKGSLATIGKNKAVVEIGFLHLGGVIAWFAWMAIHLISLVGFRSKMVTFVNWVRDYFSPGRDMRIIIRGFDLFEAKRKRKKEFEE